MSQTVEDRVVALIRKTVNRPDVELDANTDLAELGIESLDLVELIFAIEDEFGVEVPYNANDQSGELVFAKVGDAVAAVERLLKPAGGVA